MSLCPDCGAVAHGTYCPSCGQRVDVDPRSFRYWVGHFLDETLSLNGRLPRTLQALLLRPGFLTREWRQGRRSRWTSPFRLYLLCSAVFFAAATLFPQPLFESTRLGPDAALSQALINSQQEARARWAPQLVIVFVPVLAVLLKLVFHRRAYLVEHLVHAFHLQGFALLLMSTWYVVGLVPERWRGVGVVLVALLPVYGVSSCLRVYGQARLSGALRTGVVLVAHIALLAAAFDGVGRLGGVAPSETLAALEEEYWRVREAEREGTAGFGMLWQAVKDHQSVQAFLLTPTVRVHLADLLLRLSQHEAARIAAEEVLVSDPENPLALGVAARAAEADSLFHLAAEYRARFLTAYADRGADPELSRHREDLEELEAEADASASASAGGDPPPGSRS